MVNVVILENENSSGYFLLFSQISEYFKTSFISRIKYLNKNKKIIFTIIGHNSESKEIAINFFRKFPLLGKISKDFNDWCEVRLNPNKFETVVAIKMLKQKSLM